MTCHSEASMTMIYDYVLISQEAHVPHCSPNISKEFLHLFLKFPKLRTLKGAKCELFWPFFKTI